MKRIISLALTLCMLVTSTFAAPVGVGVESVSEISPETPANDIVVQEQSATVSCDEAALQGELSPSYRGKTTMAHTSVGANVNHIGVPIFYADFNNSNYKGTYTNSVGNSYSFLGDADGNTENSKSSQYNYNYWNYGYIGMSNSNYGTWVKQDDGDSYVTRTATGTWHTSPAFTLGGGAKAMIKQTGTYYAVLDMKFSQTSGINYLMNNVHPVFNGNFIKGDNGTVTNSLITDEVAAAGVSGMDNNDIGFTATQLKPANYNFKTGEWITFIATPYYIDITDTTHNYGGLTGYKFDFGFNADSTIEETVDFDNFTIYYLKDRTISFNAGSGTPVNAGDIVVKGQYADISAAKATNNALGQKFLGWKVPGTNEIITNTTEFYTADDVTLEAVYDEPSFAQQLPFVSISNLEMYENFETYGSGKKANDDWATGDAYVGKSGYSTYFGVSGRNVAFDLSSNTINTAADPKNSGKYSAHVASDTTFKTGTIRVAGGTGGYPEGIYIAVADMYIPSSVEADITYAGDIGIFANGESASGKKVQKDKWVTLVSKPIIKAADNSTVVMNFDFGVSAACERYYDNLAIFKIPQRTITLVNPDTSKGVIDTTSIVVTGVYADLAAVKISSNGAYYFAGWKNTATGEIVVEDLSYFFTASDVTLEAVWEFAQTVPTFRGTIDTSKFGELFFYTNLENVASYDFDFSTYMFDGKNNFKGEKFPDGMTMSMNMNGGAISITAEDDYYSKTGNGWFAENCFLSSVNVPKGTYTVVFDRYIKGSGPYKQNTILNGPRLIGDTQDMTQTYGMTDISSSEYSTGGVWTTKNFGSVYLSGSEALQFWLTVNDSSASSVVGYDNFAIYYLPDRTITFNDGTTETNVSVEGLYLKSTQIPAPQKVGYTLAGWSETEGGEVIADITSYYTATNKTLYAVWEEATPTSAFLGNPNIDTSHFGDLILFEDYQNGYIVDSDAVTTWSFGVNSYKDKAFFVGGLNAGSDSQGTYKQEDNNIYQESSGNLNTWGFIAPALYSKGVMVAGAYAPVGTYTAVFDARFHDDDAIKYNFTPTHANFDKALPQYTTNTWYTLTSTYSWDSSKNNMKTHQEFQFGSTDATETRTVDLDNFALYYLPNRTLTFSGATENGTVVIGQYITLEQLNSVTAPEEQGKVFLGWSTTQNGKAIDLTTHFFSEDATVYPVYGTVDESKTVYVSNDGDDDNNGEETAPVKTLAAAIQLCPGKVVLMNDVASPNLASFSYIPEIVGATGSETLTHISTLALSSDLTVDNLKLSGVTEIIANGYALTIGENVTTDSNLTVYGGKSGEALTGDTNITLLGGTYANIYGGGKNADVTGDTNVVVGGNVNPGKDIDDTNTETLAPTYVYGGGYNGAVSGTTNVTLKGNAVVKYLVGAGYGTTSQCTSTNIRIEGGKVMNVYGGAAGNGATLTNCNTKITMTGGVAESLFGGSEALAMTGNTELSLISGTVYRRVYSGCYNNATRELVTLTWSSSHVVTGTTTLMIYPDMQLNQNSYLSDDNDSNIGVYAGSRTKSASDDEVNIVIFENGCYDSKNGVIGSQDTASILVGLKSYADYTVKSGKNGLVLAANNGKNVYIQPDSAYIGSIGSTTYKNANAVLSDKTTTVTFAFDKTADQTEIEDCFKAENVDIAIRSDVSYGDKTKQMGVRIVAMMNEEKRGELINNDGSEYEMGFIVTRKVKLGNIAPEDFTLDSNIAKVSGVSYNTKSTPKVDKLWLDYNGTGNTAFSGVMVGIPEDMYKDDLVFRSYIKFTIGDKEYISYGEPKIVNVYDVAEAIYNSSSSTSDQKAYANSLMDAYYVAINP